MRIVLVGTKQKPRSSVARELEKKYNFKIVPMFDAVNRIYRILRFDEARWSRVPWETTTKIYDAIYKIDNNLWINYLEKRLETTTRDVVIPDVRYQYEVERLKNLGFIVVRVKHLDKIENINIGKSLLDAAEGTVIVNEYYGKSSVDFAITFESVSNMKDVVHHMISRLNKDPS